MRRGEADTFDKAGSFRAFCYRPLKSQSLIRIKFIFTCIDVQN